MPKINFSQMSEDELRAEIVKMDAMRRQQSQAKRTESRVKKVRAFKHAKQDEPIDLNGVEEL